jgi:dihydroorotase-like cyclic amidohydrolase
MSEQELQQLIYRVATHWGRQLGESPEQVLEYLRGRKAPVMVEPEDNSFAARGQAAKIERGLNALRAAMNGTPSSQWLAAWGDK